MGKSSSVRGAKAERDSAAILSDLLGRTVRRALGAGRNDDVGDLDGVDGWAIQVAARADLGSTIRQKPLDAEIQAIHRGVPFGVALMKLPPRPGGKPQEWRVVMTPETFARVVLAMEADGT